MNKIIKILAIFAILSGVVGCSNTPARVYPPTVTKILFDMEVNDEDATLSNCEMYRKIPESNHWEILECEMVWSGTCAESKSVKFVTQKGGYLLIPIGPQNGWYPTGTPFCHIVLGGVRSTFEGDRRGRVEFASWEDLTQGE